MILRRLIRAVRPSDFLWAFAAPLYYILYSLRHEGFHALAAILVRAPIREFHINPTGAFDGTHSAGFVLVESTNLNVVILAAPYFGDLLIPLVCLALTTWLTKRISNRHLWLNLVFLTSGLSFLNSLLNFYAFISFHGGDLGLIAGTVSPFWVDWYCSVSIGLNALVTMSLFLRLESISKPRLINPAEGP